MIETELTMRGARRLAAGLLCAVASLPAQAASWLLAAADPMVAPGEVFQVVVIAPADSEALPPRLAARIAPAGAGQPLATVLAEGDDIDAVQAVCAERLGRLETLLYDTSNEQGARP